MKNFSIFRKFSDSSISETPKKTPRNLIVTPKNAKKKSDKRKSSAISPIPETPEPKKPKKSTKKEKEPEVPIIPDREVPVWLCPVCKLGENGDQWICCDMCGDESDEWWHWKCVGVLEAPEDGDKWYCPDCVEKGKIKKKVKKKRKN